MPGKTIHRIKSISEFHKIKGVASPQHPLISVIDYNEIECYQGKEPIQYIFDFYQISIKRGIGAKLKYGQQRYDFDNGIMFFISPNQVFGVEPVENTNEKRSGWMLLIHPDFLWNTSLAKNIKQYDFFGYSVNEALFLSSKEEQTVNNIIHGIQQEYSSNIDKFSQSIIVAQLELLLTYSDRYYQRQFITRKITSHHTLQNLEKILNDYFNNDSLISKGLPTVQYVSEVLNISPSYLSSMLKSLTGQSTQQHIHDKVIEKAKEKLSTTELTVSEIAYELGFEHSQSFSKLFKTKTNQSPLQFRQSFN